VVLTVKREWRNMGLLKRVGESLDYRLAGYRVSKIIKEISDRAIVRGVKGDKKYLRNELFYQPRENYFTSLCDLYGSDKGSNQTSGHPYPWNPHTYASIYSLLFSHCRDSFKQVLECGIGTNDPNLKSNMSKTGMPGASLRVWRDFFPAAQITGIDIDEKTMFEDERINTFIVDQTDVSSIQRFLNMSSGISYDLVIDDGLHEFSAGITLFLEMFSYLKLGGIYIIEDVLMQDLKKYKGYFSETDYDVSYVLLQRSETKIGDNCLIIIRNTQKL
jgi:hypothetical protein